ncbi:MAG: hypothetical protein KAJ54_02375 [Candidatus Aenigmarchaeota archaeon]|nr:hypothetical protein [Candidatus Aenigmarchaeota archaeon]MCK5322416.1 hypothetical protein [Candidatus Aenigmarchaeota archaeon]
MIVINVEGIDLPEGKLAFFWFLGAVALSGGAWLLGQRDATAFQNIAAFILILVAGLSWVGVGVGVVHRHSLHKR